MSEDETEESGVPALYHPDSPGSLGVLELQEDLGFPLLCLSDPPQGWGPASGQIL